ncbi:MAG TPA: hypothetical protein VK932_27945 [Kofleriaceae bacterium]|nr:hypothetical protein [Kofleriaceae bacterium]
MLKIEGTMPSRATFRSERERERQHDRGEHDRAAGAPHHDEEDEELAHDHVRRG